MLVQDTPPRREGGLRNPDFVARDLNLSPLHACAVRVGGHQTRRGRGGRGLVAVRRWAGHELVGRLEALLRQRFGRSLEMQTRQLIGCGQR